MITIKTKASTFGIQSQSDVSAFVSCASWSAFIAATMKNRYTNHFTVEAIRWAESNFPTVSSIKWDSEIFFKLAFCIIFFAAFSTTLAVTFPATSPIVNKTAAAIIFGAAAATEFAKVVSAAVSGSMNELDVCWACTKLVPDIANNNAEIIILL